MPTASANQLLFHWLSAPDASGTALFWLSALAQWPLYGLPVLLVGLWLLGARGDRKAAVAAGVTCCVALLAAHTVSVWIDHPRPFMIGLAANVLDHAPDGSFPSDHATLMFAAAASFGLGALPRLRWLGLALAVIGLATGWARVALGVHFPFDIFGAAVIAGLSEVFVAARIIRRPLEILMAIGEAIRDRLPILPGRRSGPPKGTVGGDAHLAR
jgi:undecaprenyl-diphosphatase